MVRKKSNKAVLIVEATLIFIVIGLIVFNAYNQSNNSYSYPVLPYGGYTTSPTPLYSSISSVLPTPSFPIYTPSPTQPPPLSITPIRSTGFSGFESTVTVTSASSYGGFQQNSFVVSENAGVGSDCWVQFLIGFADKNHLYSSWQPNYQINQVYVGSAYIYKEGNINNGPSYVFPVSFPFTIREQTYLDSDNYVKMSVWLNGVLVASFNSGLPKLDSSYHFVSQPFPAGYTPPKQYPFPATNNLESTYFWGNEMVWYGEHTGVGVYQGQEVPNTPIVTGSMKAMVFKDGAWSSPAIALIKPTMWWIETKTPNLVGYASATAEFTRYLTFDVRADGVYFAPNTGGNSAYNGFILT